MIHQRTVYYGRPLAARTGDGSGAPIHSSWRPFLPGAMLVAIGVLIALVPELLVALVATAFVSVGILALAVAWRVRKVMEEAHRFHSTGQVDPWFGTPVDDLLYRFSAH